MDFFSEYLQPITSWVSLHPHWALLLTFVISFSESLAFIGSIVPGSVTMTAIGILAGSGVMRIDLTLLAAIMGAIAGDSASYAIGRIFSDKLRNLWPFNRYPKWLDYGKDYFERHGGKSVLIGRFTGPLRSLIPIIAGMMKMNQWHFIVANVLSAIGWSLLYVAPGILIGTASTELSPQTASKLFVVILLLLAAVWMLSHGVKWVFTQINHWLRLQLNSLWKMGLQNSSLKKIARCLTPQNDADYYPTAAIVLTLILFCILIPIGLYTSTHSLWINSLNESIHQFCLSIRTGDFDAFFIIIRLDISYVSLLSFGLAILIYAFYHRDWRLLKFWISLIITSGLLTALLSHTLAHPFPISTDRRTALYNFSSNGLIFATSLLGFLNFYMAKFYKQTISVICRILLLSALILTGAALIYLGEDWFTNITLIYLIGFENALLHWMFYRRIGKPHYRSHLPIILSFILFIIATAVSSLLFFHTVAERQQPHIKQFVIDHNAWWKQKKPLLPLYTSNRFGRNSSLMNIQYVGSIHYLLHTLENAGWKRQRDSFFYSLFLRMSHKKSTATLPLMTQLYVNRKPEILMTYGASNDEDSVILRLWRSNYHVNNHNQTVWIGSIQKQNPKNKVIKSIPIDVLLQILNGFETKKLILNLKLQPLPVKAFPAILLIETRD